MKSGFLEQRRFGSAAGRENHMPPLAEYEAWLATTDPRGHSRTQSYSAGQYRRIATMRRAGETFAEIARSLGGRSFDGVCSAYGRLPEHLK